MKLENTEKAYELLGKFRALNETYDNVLNYIAECDANDCRIGDVTMKIAYGGDYWQREFWLSDISPIALLVAAKLQYKSAIDEIERELKEL